MTLIALALTLAVTYVVASDAVFLALFRLVGKSSRPSRLSLFFLTRGAGPALLSLAFYYLLLLVPGRSAAFYLAAVSVVLGSLLVLGRSGLTALLATYREVGQKVWSAVKRAGPASTLFGTSILVLAGIGLGVGYPIVEHDGLAAAVEARIMVRDMSMKAYLDVRQPDSVTGYYMSTFRTPYLQTLYVWFAMAGGAEQMDLLARTVSPTFGVLCLLLLGFLVYRRGGAEQALWATFLLAATPLFFYMSYNNGIDTARLYLSLAACVGFAELIDHGDGGYRLAVVTGLLSGLAIYSHPLGVFAVAGGALTFLASRQWRFGGKAAAGVLIALFALFTSAQVHYLIHPEVTQEASQALRPELVKKELQELAELVATKETETPRSTPESTAEPRGERTSPAAASQSTPEATKEDSPAELKPVAVELTPELQLLESRGQGRSTLSQLLFGRLQMFTGVEYFGFTFFLFWASLVMWLRGGSKSSLDVVLLATALVGCAVVLSGIRSYSWSNPRYIASLLVVAAYFAAPFLSAITDRLRRFSSRRPMAPGVWLLTFTLCFPTILVTSIRGAKVGITNPGTFYSDFRSLRWLRSAFEDPAEAATVLWRDYLGIRKTLRYLLADDETKLLHSHDYFAGVLYLAKNAPATAKVLLFRDARFFYYCDRRGVVGYSPEFDRKPFTTMTTAEDRHRLLLAQGFTHILLDSYSKSQFGHGLDLVSVVLESPELVEVEYEFGSATVYRLRPLRHWG